MIKKRCKTCKHFDEVDKVCEIPSINKECPKVKKVRIPEPSKGEAAFELTLRAYGFKYQREVALVPGRKWRVDFLLDHGFIVEIEGGVWSQGRHLRGKGWLNDAEKYNTLTALGYKVLRFATHQVCDKDGNPTTEAIDWIREHLALRIETSDKKNKGNRCSTITNA